MLSKTVKISSCVLDTLSYYCDIATFIHLNLVKLRGSRGVMGKGGTFHGVNLWASLYLC